MMDWWNEWPSTTVKWKFDGDVEASKAMRGEGSKLLYQLKNIMRIGGLNQWQMFRKMADGSTLFAKSVFGQDFVTITTPTKVVVSEAGYIDHVPVLATYSDKKIYFHVADTDPSSDKPIPNFYIDVSGTFTNPTQNLIFALRLVEDNPKLGILVYFRNSTGYPYNINEAYVLRFKVGDLLDPVETDTYLDPASTEPTDTTYYKADFTYALDTYTVTEDAIGEALPVPAVSLKHPSQGPATAYRSLVCPELQYQTIPGYTDAYLVPDDGILTPHGQATEGNPGCFDITISCRAEMVSWSGGGMSSRGYTSFSVTFSETATPGVTTFDGVRVFTDDGKSFTAIGAFVWATSDTLASIQWELFYSAEVYFKTTYTLGVTVSVSPGTIYVPYGGGLSGGVTINLTSAFASMYPPTSIEYNQSFMVPVMLSIKRGATALEKHDLMEIFDKDWSLQLPAGGGPAIGLVGELHSYGTPPGPTDYVWDGSTYIGNYFFPTWRPGRYIKVWPVAATSRVAPSLLVDMTEMLYAYPSTKTHQKYIYSINQTHRLAAADNATDTYGDTLPPLSPRYYVYYTYDYSLLKPQRYPYRHQGGGVSALHSCRIAPFNATDELSKDRSIYFTGTGLHDDDLTLESFFFGKNLSKTPYPAGKSARELQVAGDTFKIKSTPVLDSVISQVGDGVLYLGESGFEILMATDEAFSENTGSTRVSDGGILAV